MEQEITFSYLQLCCMQSILKLRYPIGHSQWPMSSLVAIRAKAMKNFWPMPDVTIK